MLRLVLAIAILSASLFSAPVQSQHPAELHIEAVGGEAKLAALKSMQRSGTADIESAEGRFSGKFQEVYDLKNDRGSVSLATTSFSQVTGWVGERGWKSHSVEGPDDVGSDELGLAKITATPSFVASLVQQYGLGVFQVGEESEFKGVMCDVLTIGGSPLSIYLNKKTHLLEAVALPPILEFTFSDYKAVDGVQLPHASVMSIAVAGLKMSYEYDAVTLFDTELDESLFDRPAAEAEAGTTKISYSEAQAAAGKIAYAEHCASCHAPDLSGSHISPGLIGARFDQNWRGKTADVLSFHIRRMPPEAEAVQLTEETHTNLLAYVLQANAFEAGAALASDLMTLGSVEIPQLEGATFDPDVPVELSRRQTITLSKLEPVTDEMRSNPPAEDWLSWGGSARGLNYSSLDKVNTENVAELVPAWRTALRGGPSMSIPLVHQGIMFMQTFPDTTLALDAQTGDVLWRYQRPGIMGSSQKMGIALSGDKVLVPTSDLHVVALEAKTGKVVWDHAIKIEVPKGGRGGQQLRSAPLIAGGQVIQGVTASFASRGGFLVAIDLETGEESWRFDTIAKPGEEGGNTWNGVEYDKRSGGSVWHQGTYDPELNLVYYGVAPTYDTGPLLKSIEKEGITSEALYTNCTIALNPETGELVWYYQHMQNDQWDLDWVFERQIASVMIDGKKRKAVMNVGKVAILEAVDAATGEYLFSVDPGTQNVIASIDPETGAKTFDLSKMPDPKKETVVCPSAAGGRSWPPTAYSPATSMVYVPITEWCMTLGPKGARLLTSGVGISEAVHPDAVDGKLAKLQAIDVANQKLAWKHEQVAPISTGLLATAGGVIFSGDLEPSLKALDAETGAVLWRQQLDDVPSSSIITYSVGRTQYVAILVGISNIHVQALNGAYAALTSDRDVEPVSLPKGGASIWVFSL